MLNTLSKDIDTVRSMLGDPLGQSPSVLDILEELRIEYQTLTNDLNNSTDAWMISTYNLTTVAGQYEYQLSTTGAAEASIGKVLSVVTVPADANLDPEYVVEFVEMDKFPKEWAWIARNKGAYAFSSHDGQLIAFYYQFSVGDGWLMNCQIRPVPAAAQTYKIIYQPGDWWDLDSNLGVGVTLPVESQKFLVCAVAAKNLLSTGKVRWSYDEAADDKKSLMILGSLNDRIARYLPIYDEFKEGLTKNDMLILDSWADENVLQ